MKYKTTCPILQKNYDWLPRDLKVEEIVYHYFGCDYGCISHQGIAVTFEENKIPFFEVPVKYLEVIDG